MTLERAREIAKAMQTLVDDAVGIVEQMKDVSLPAGREQDTRDIYDEIIAKLRALEFDPDRLTVPQLLTGYAKRLHSLQDYVRMSLAFTVADTKSLVKLVNKEIQKMLDLKRV